MRPDRCCHHINLEKVLLSSTWGVLHPHTIGGVPAVVDGCITSGCYPESGEENVDCATLVQNDNQETHIYDYHIIYSFSFKIPVLYFRGHQSDGRPLRHDEIQIDLPSHSLSILRESKWTYMTQEDRPSILAPCPWFMYAFIHPCGTRDWMKLLFPNNQAMEGHVVQQYLASWLSVGLDRQSRRLRVALEMQRQNFYILCFCYL